MRRRVAALLLAVIVLVAGGCGAQTSVSGSEDVGLLLDFTPNAVHAGIYTARAWGFDGGEGVRLHIRVPGQSTDAVRLLAAGRVDLAVLDIHDLALARRRGVDVVGVMPLVQRPLAAVIAAPGVRSPRALAGRRVGVTGLPSDEAVLRSIVRGAGGDPARVRITQIGFGAVGALLAGRVDGATAFWNVEGVVVHRRRPGFRVFRVDDFGAPPYPELVLCATRRTLRERPEAVRGTVRALRRGYEQVLTDPESSLADLEQGTRGLDRTLLAAELDAVTPAFFDAHDRAGVFDRRRLQAWARWEAEFGIVPSPPDVARAFAFSL